MHSKKINKFQISILTYPNFMCIFVVFQRKFIQNRVYQLILKCHTPFGDSNTTFKRGLRRSETCWFKPTLRFDLHMYDESGSIERR